MAHKRSLRPLSAYLPADLYAALEAAAHRDGRSVAGQARALLAQGLGMPLETLQRTHAPRAPRIPDPAPEPEPVASTT